MLNILHSLHNESDTSLIKLVYAGRTSYIASVSNSKENTTKYVLIQSGLITGANTAHELLQLIAQDTTLQIPERDNTIAWASEMLQANVNTSDSFDIDALLMSVTNKGLTKSSLEVIGCFIKLVNDYRWQVENAELGKLLEMPSIKKLWWLYSDYVFWEKIPKDISFEEQIGALDRHQVKADFTKLIEAFINCISLPVDEGT